jgi:hypothetical protein
VNVNVRRGKYEGTTRVSEREKREKEGLIFKISKKRREGEISSSTEKQPLMRKREKKRKISLFCLLFLKKRRHTNIIFCLR